jgi:hypothetical protein
MSIKRCLIAAMDRDGGMRRASERSENPHPAFPHDPLVIMMDTLG